MSRPVVSVVMPVRDGGSFLKDSIESILLQSYEDFEFVIVNDYSQHDTEEALYTFSMLDRRIKLIQNSGTPGIAGALNVGCSNAAGGYIARHDADDISLADRLKWQVDVLHKRRELAIVGSFLQMIDESSQPLKIHREPLGEPAVRFHLQIGTPFAHPSVMIRTRCLRQMPEAYREVPAQDYDLWARMILAGARGDNIPAPLVCYRIHSRSDSILRASEHGKMADQIARRCLAALTGRAPIEHHCSGEFRDVAHAVLTGNALPRGDCPHEQIEHLYELIRLCRKRRTFTWLESRKLKKAVQHSTNL